MFNQVFGELISENIEEGLVVIRYEVNAIRYQRFLSVMKVKAVKFGNHLTRCYLVAVVITSRKKEILSFYEPDNLECVASEIGSLPLDVSGVSYLLHGMESFNKRHQLESTRRTLEAMVKVFGVTAPVMVCLAQ